MKFVSVRDLRVQPGDVWRQLRESEELVLTSNGRPIALLVDVDEADVEETLVALRRIRAQRALSRLRRASAEQQLDQLSPDDIEAEIAEVRRERRS